MRSTKEGNVYTLYVHITPNGKLYIGITSKKVSDRWGDNGSGYFTSKYFYKAIQKYGWDNIDHIILLENLSKDAACECEKYLIAKYRSNNSKYGYNLASGGEVNRGYHFNQTQQVRAHLHEIKIGIPLSISHRESLKRAWIQRKQSGKGVPWNKGLKLKNTGKIDNFMKAGIQNGLDQARPIYQMTLDGDILARFSSVRAASRYLGLSYSSGIFAALSNKQKSAHGYKWKYVD